MHKHVFDLLDPSCIVETTETLEKRIAARFPEAGLRQQARRLVEISKGAGAGARRLSRPSIFTRLLVMLLVMGGALAGYYVYQQWGVNLKPGVDTVGALLQALESGLNDLIFLGAGLFFLFSADGRIKRARALKAIHALRSFAHVIDMRQLTKDPDRITRPASENTEASPKLNLNRRELTWYLDYCSDMLALVGKIAALYAQYLRDPVALAAVNEVEALVSGLSGKIMTKLQILSEQADREAHKAAAA
jgi:hypothetical protein